VATDVPGVECYNHTPGQAIPCQCGRFYCATTCDPPRWFSYNQSESQPLISKWRFLNRVDNLASPDFNTLLCNWLWVEEDMPAEEIHFIQLKYLDNPTFDPILDPNRFLATIDVYFRSDLLIVTQYRATKRFGGITTCIPRNHTWGTLVADWVKIHGLPGSTPPVGFQTYLPVFCLPGV